MKKAKEFNVDDKVFAKVKGYPAWPAKVVKKNDKKYDVVFYGTKETGTIKVDDLFYFLRHKNQFLKKPPNRKFYKEALEEIEADIEKDGGTDGDNSQNDTLDNSVISNTSLNESIDKSTSKRKRSLEKTDPEKKSAKKVHLDNSDVSNNLENIDPTTEKEIQPESRLEDNPQENDASNGHKNISNKYMEETKQVSEESCIDTKNIPIISAEYLKALIDFAEKVSKTQDVYKKKSVEPRDVNGLHILIVKSVESTIGIKFNKGPLPQVKNEYDVAQYEGKEAKRVLDIAEKVKDGKLKPEDEPDSFVTCISKSDEEITKEEQQLLSKQKHHNLEFLKTELEMVSLDTKIKGALGLQNAEPPAALESLKALIDLDIKPIMLKKHPHIVDMVKRLRKYIGNLKEWKLSDTEEEAFNEKATQIRDLAEKVYQKLKDIFNVHDDKSFWDMFNNEVNVFKENTKDLTEDQISCLCDEPDSRRTFIDLTLINSNKTC